jgi:hypothetical protein
LRVPGINAISQDPAGALVVDGLPRFELRKHGKDSIAEPPSLVTRTLDALRRRTGVRADVNKSLDTAGRPISTPVEVSALGPYLVRRTDFTERRHMA